MTFPTDWDVDKYHVEYESEEHWELRRRFLVAHKDKYPEDRLVCLAQVFYNVEFMGCRYPEKTMRLVAQLSDGVADEHREKQKTKLQRTFVQASDAASTKVKGRSKQENTAQIHKPINFQPSTNSSHIHQPINFQKSTEDKLESMHTETNEPQDDEEEEEETPPIEPSSSETPLKKKKRARKSKKKRATNTVAEPSSDNIPGRFVLANQSRFEEHRTNNKRPLPEAKDPPAKKPKSLEQLASRLVLMKCAGLTEYGILSRSAGSCQINLQQEKRHTKAGVEVTLSMDGLVLSKATAHSIEIAKAECSKDALNKLEKLCYTLVLKDRFAGSVIDKTNVSDANTPEEVPAHLAEDSKANRMMKLMGWGGRGLGKNQQGREEPVQVVQQVKRAGLGQKECGPEFNKNITDMLQKFKRSDEGHDIVFASDFSKEERKMVHNIAARFGLKSVSYGKDANRQLVVSKKKRPMAIVEEVKRAGGSTAKYDVIPPKAD